MPLSCMNTFAQDWVIKCKVTKKNMRNWSNARGNGTMLNVDLIDKTGTQI
jgi:replication factor A1